VQRATQERLRQRLRAALPQLMHDVSGCEPAGIALYALADPRDVRALRYIGQTGSPARRYRQHVRAACLGAGTDRPWWICEPHLLALHRWIHALHADGNRLPFMLVTHWTATIADARALERQLILEHIAAGHELLNREATCSCSSTVQLSLL
jgi:hypothetical protein